MEETCGVEVDVEARGCENVLLDAGVLADSQSNAPAIELERDQPAAGREADRLLATEVALAVGDVDAVRPDLQRANVGRPSMPVTGAPASATLFASACVVTFVCATAGRADSRQHGR
ncbi:MAG: hypothetical protein WA484_03350 [Solirubrobacteraceae bacterium]